jgi:eukaryotic-like serine/threonine-protein kinase
VCSPGAVRSRWVNREIETFKRLGRQDRILLIIADGEPRAGGERECFPEAVRDIEPIAADARPHADGPGNAKLKIIAGMLGVRFDVLRDRDAQLRMQRLRRAFAVAASLVLIFAVLASVAWRQRRVAIEQRELAVQRTNSLRDVLSRLIWRVHDDVDGLPGSDNLKMDLLNGSVSELTALQAVDLADNGLARLVAGSHSRLGMVQFDVDQVAAARASFAKAISIAEALTANDKQNGLYLLDLAEYLRHMADVDLAQGDPLAGKAKAERGLSILRALPSDLPTSVRAMIRHEMAQNRLLSAEASWRANNPSAAIPDFERSNAIYESFLTSYPDATQFKIEYSEAMLLQARFYLQTGKLAKSREICASVAKLLPAFEVIDRVDDNDVANGGGAGNQDVRPVGHDLEDGKIRNSLQKNLSSSIDGDVRDVARQPFRRGSDKLCHGCMEHGDNRHRY